MACCLVVSLLDFASTVHASKLSQFFKKQQEKARLERERQRHEDLDFAQLQFRLKRSYIADNGDKCRIYEFRSTKNTFKHGKYEVCD